MWWMFWLGCQPAPDAMTMLVDRGDPDEVVDVLVVGAGAAGLAAAVSATEAGATVRVVERNALAGGNGRFAGRWYAVGTAWQDAQGIPDDPAAALADWPAWSLGGDPSDPRVEQLVTRSADTLAWVVGIGGAEVLGVGWEDGFEDMSSRMHVLKSGDDGPVAHLEARVADRITVSREVTEIVFDGERAVGAGWQDLDTGEIGWTEARGGVVVASGGFARDLAAVLADRPTLDGAPLGYEMGFTATGAAVPAVLAAGAAWQNAGGISGYVHSIADPRPGFEGEVLWVPGATGALIVDQDGRRVGNEATTSGFGFAALVEQAPGKTLYALLPSAAARDFAAPSYTIAQTPQDVIPQGELVEAGAVAVADGAVACGEAWGIDPDGLAETVARYNGIQAAGVDAEFGKAVGLARPLPSGPFSVLCAPLVVGLAKSFSGFAADLDGRLLTADDAPIPGLYGAGEAIGVLGTPAVGRGFSGSITAIVLGGRVAGEAAAREAHP